MPEPSSTSSSESSVARDRGPLLVALGLAVGLLGLDRGLRVDPPFAEFGEDLQPFAHSAYAIDPAIVPGLSATTRFFRNAQGLRGHVLDGGPHDVLLVGGSTVACTLLDERDTLGAAIERSASRPARVAALGRGGYPLARLLPLIDRALRDPDLRPGTIVLVLGANEVELLMNHLPWGTQPEWDVDGPYGPRRWSETFAGWYRANADGRFLLRPRAAYAAAAKRDELTPQQRAMVDGAAREFGAALTAVVRASTSVGTRVLLVTQPLAFDVATGRARDGWAPFFHAEPGQGIVPSARLVHEWVERFNDVVRDVGATQGVRVVDLGAAMSDCAACFYDQWHFTVAGASRGGAEIGAALAE